MVVLWCFCFSVEYDVACVFGVDVWVSGDCARVGREFPVK